jgi:hypothetical protein
MIEVIDIINLIIEDREVSMPGGLDGFSGINIILSD